MRIESKLIFLFLLISLSANSQVSFPEMLKKYNFLNYSVGGFKNSDHLGGLTYPQFNKQVTRTVKNTAELISCIATAKDGDVIYLLPNGNFDLTKNTGMVISKSISLISDRGSNNSEGATIYSNSLDVNPLIYVKAQKVVIRGVKIKGPDGEHINKHHLNEAFKNLKNKNSFDQRRFNTYGIPNSIGIIVDGDRFTLENCELYNWSHSGIVVRNKSTVSILNNYIHHNQRYGLGYGISIHSGHAVIRYNYFDFNRHDVASTGTSECSYLAEMNICLLNTNINGHNFDMHGGSDRKDKTDIAGKYFQITNNLIFISTIHSPLLIRGNPRLNSVFGNNFIIEIRKNNNKNYLDSKFEEYTGKLKRIQIRGNQRVKELGNLMYKQVI